MPAGWAGYILDLIIVYGLGLLAFFLAFGVRPLRNYVRRLDLSAREGFRWYGTFALIGILLAFALAIGYVAVDYSRYTELIHQTTNVQNAGAANPLFYILFSLFFVGFVEETLFRGYVFGTLLTIFGTKRWRVYAVWTSLLFAGVHLYYAQTYLEVSPIYYVQLVALGLAFSYTYALSGGNLLVIALIHGGFDAISFFSLTSAGKTDNIALVLSYGLVFCSALWALVLYLRNPSPRDSWDGAPEVTAQEWPPLPRSEKAPR